jgi:tetraprenyl-beta-curcumene synthase
VEREKLGLALAEHWLTARAGAALVLANARYWPTVAPAVHAQLHHWEQHAKAIPDPSLRVLALTKLRHERFNAEVAATLATLAPRAYRAHAVRAIVAFEVMYDYLDGVTEQPAADPLRNGHQLFQAFTDALTPHTALSSNYYRYHPHSEDGGYLQELANVVRVAFAQLPAATAIAATARSSAARCAEAQIRVHAAQHIGTAQLECWATREAEDTDLDWREYLAGAVASVLVVHALIAAAADRRTSPKQAAAIDITYLSISALSTMLDSLIDYQDDLITDTSWYLEYYKDRSRIADPLTRVARHATREARILPHAAHHNMTLVGVVAYYTSAPAARDDLARPLVRHIQRELRPLITPTLAVMRAWRIAKQLHHGKRELHTTSETRT